jgi:hypothetical protein
MPLAENSLGVVLRLIAIAGAWGFVSILLLGIAEFVRDVWSRSQRLHQIPCADCQYYAGQPVLKCTLHPHNALSEAAIHCPDFWKR